LTKERTVTTRSTLINTLQATNVVAAGKIFGNVYQGDVRRPDDYILDFDLDAAARGFVGRAEVFGRLDSFADHYPGGYFEIIADAGLGKTALAAEIARRRDAVTFLASASSGARRAEQFLAHMSASLIVRYQLDHRTLPARVGEDATYLLRILRESVQRVSGRPIWLVVDGLDEAIAPPSGSNPLLLPPDLPDGVYVVVTRRAGQLITGPGTPLLRYTLHPDDPQQIDDIRTFILRRFESDQRIADMLAGRGTPGAREEAVARLVAASEGNFMYVSFVLSDLAARDPASAPADLMNLPVGLSGYYHQFWEQMAPAPGQSWADWDNLFRPVLERLAVAREPVTAEWLSRQVGRPAIEVQQRVLSPWIRLLGHAEVGESQAWRLVHRSFAEFLDDKLDLAGAHRAIASYYRAKWGQFEDWDDYGLRHVPAHLSELARRTPEDERHSEVALLVRLVTEHRFQRTYLDRLRDPVSLRRDVEEAHLLTAKDPHPQATFLLVVIALTLIRFRRQMLQPAAVFDAARRGDLSTAERLLDLFEADIDVDWQRVIQLSLAWLAAPRAPEAALRLCDRVAESGPTAPNVLRLLAHLRAALQGDPTPPGNLPPAASPFDAEAMLVRLAGAGDSSLLAAHGLGSAGDLLGGGGYLATTDGPPLVALALADPLVGERLLGRYLDIHVAYGYRQYRNQSLWELLSAVLMHPQPDWVREWLVRLGVAVLAAPTRGEFLEGLEIAVSALQAVAGDEAAHAEIETRRQLAVEEADALPTSPLRGEGDVWATHKRRMAALAEAYTRLPDGAPTAVELAARALGIAPGFAGFAAPASLTLAESVSVAAAHEIHWIEQALAAAEASAHNIQDTTFCARTTARVTAMRDAWWPAPEPLVATVDRLVTNPSATEFCAVHIVGESYIHRESTSRVLLPERMLKANTLRELADVFQRPLPEFERHNEGHGPDDHLPVGTRVSIPDPGFAPLLAARLSAAILAAGPPSGELSALVRHLAPIAASDVTAQCTILTRLLLCSPTRDTQLVEELRRLVRDSASATPDESRLSGPRATEP
jgi:hypothetical protein